MTKVMHKFLMYLSICFCLTCFGLSFSPSSEAGVQLGQWFKSPGYGVSARALTPYLVNSTNHLHPVPSLEMCVAISLLYLGTFTTWTGKSLHCLPLPQRRTINLRSSKYKWQKQMKLRNNSFDFTSEIFCTRCGNTEYVRPLKRVAM
jgi:hypothetical protein